MSTLTDLLIQMDNRFKDLFPTHKRLIDTSIISRNPELMLEQGQGILIGAGTNTEKEIGCNLSVARTIEVILTRKISSLNLNRSGKFEDELILLEDQQSLLEDVVKNNGVFYSLESKVANFRFVQDNGLERIFEDRFDLIMIRSTFGLETFDAY